MNPEIRILPLPNASAFSEGACADRGQGHFLSLKRKLSLKVDELQASQQQEDLERKLEYYPFFFSWKDFKIYIGKGRGDRTSEGHCPDYVSKTDKTDNWLLHMLILKKSE